VHSHSAKDTRTEVHHSVQEFRGDVYRESALQSGLEMHRHSANESGHDAYSTQESRTVMYHKVVQETRDGLLLPIMDVTPNGVTDPDRQHYHDYPGFPYIGVIPWDDLSPAQRIRNNYERRHAFRMYCHRHPSFGREYSRASPVGPPGVW